MVGGTKMLVVGAGSVVGVSGSGTVVVVAGADVVGGVVAGVVSGGATAFGTALPSSGGASASGLLRTCTRVPAGTWS